MRTACAEERLYIPQYVLGRPVWRSAPVAVVDDALIGQSEAPSRTTMQQASPESSRFCTVVTRRFARRSGYWSHEGSHVLRGCRYAVIVSTAFGRTDCFWSTCCAASSRCWHCPLPMQQTASR